MASEHEPALRDVEDVEVAIVVGKACFRLERRLDVFLGIELPEAVDDRSVTPNGVAIQTVASPPAEQSAANVQIVAVESLAPGGSYQALMADLEKHKRKSAIALVGHEPDIGELAARLAGSRHAFEFKKGAACRIDLDDLPPSGPGTLRWFLTPKIMRSLRK